MQVDYLNSPKEDLIENFTESNLRTINDKKSEENYSKSLILTPYNTEKSCQSNSFKSLKIENSLCKFVPIAKQQDLKYQLNNNAEFDNGIINSQNESYQRNLHMCQNIIYNNYYDESPDINSYSPIPISPPIEMISSNNDKGKFNNSLEEVDVSLCEEIHKTIGYKTNYLMECLRNRKVNYATATYYLLLKSKKRKIIVK